MTVIPATNAIVFTQGDERSDSMVAALARKHGRNCDPDRLHAGEAAPPQSSRQHLADPTSLIAQQRRAT